MKNIIMSSLTGVMFILIMFVPLYMWLQQTKVKPIQNEELCYASFDKLEVKNTDNNIMECTVHEDGTVTWQEVPL